MKKELKLRENSLGLWKIPSSKGFSLLFSSIRLISSRRSNLKNIIIMAIYKIQRNFGRKDSYGWSQPWDDESKFKPDYWSKNRKEYDAMAPEGDSNYYEHEKIIDNIRNAGYDGRVGVKSTGIFNRDIEIRNDFDPIKNHRPIIESGGINKGHGRRKAVIANAHSAKAAYREYLDMVNKFKLVKGSELLTNKQIKDALRKQAKKANIKRAKVITGGVIGTSAAAKYGINKYKSKKDKK